MSLTDYAARAFFSDTLPAGQRTFYEDVLMATLRTKNIFTQYCISKTDFAAKSTGLLVYTEVFDTSPNWNPLTEDQLWLDGAHLDSRQITIGLERHGDVLKFGDYTELVNYWNSGDFTGLMRGKLGQNLVDYLDILAMNAHLEAPNVQYAGSATSLYDLAVDDYYDPDLGGLARTHLEEMDIPGVFSVDDTTDQAVVALTSPRIIRDIRTKNSNKWLEVHRYSNPQMKMRAEAGAWDGVRYLKSNRLRLRNYGKVTVQTTLDGAAVEGQGSAAMVQGYAVGQANAVRHVQVASAAGFAVGMTVTIHSAPVCADDGAGGHPPVRADGTQEQRRIVSIDVANNRLAFDRPLMKPHATGSYVTKGIDVTPTIILGGPSVVLGIGERPTPTFPPKIDDHMMINRIGWRAFLKFQMFRPEWTEIIWSAISDD